MNNIIFRIPLIGDLYILTDDWPDNYWKLNKSDLIMVLGKSELKKWHHDNDSYIAVIVLSTKKIILDINTKGMMWSKFQYVS